MGVALMGQYRKPARPSSSRSSSSTSRRRHVDMSEWGESTDLRTGKVTKKGPTEAQRRQMREQRERGARDRDEFKREVRSERRQKVVAKTRKGTRTAGRQLRRSARQLRDPFTETVSTGSQAMVLTLAVIALYVLLNNAGHASGFFGAIGRVVQWLGDPGRSVPYSPAHDRPGG